MHTLNPLKILYMPGFAQKRGFLEFAIYNYNHVIVIRHSNVYSVNVQYCSINIEGTVQFLKHTKNVPRVYLDRTTSVP